MRDIEAATSNEAFELSVEYVKHHLDVMFYGPFRHFEGSFAKGNERIVYKMYLGPATGLHKQ